jgi:hypothetical protein
MKTGSISAILIAGLWPVALGQSVSAPASVPAAAAPISGLAPAQPTAPPPRRQDRRAGRRNPQAAASVDNQQATAHGPQRRRIQPEASAANQNSVNEHGRSAHQRPAINYSQAVKRQHRERHDRGWWKQRYTTIVLVNGCGYYYWDAGYWFPAFGYEPQYENYQDNGPIYTYGNLLPDQVIYNVQAALKELGYYSGPLSGSMSGTTRTAVSAFQEDNGLDVTGAIDAPTVEALGLY